MAIHRVGQPTDRPTPSAELGRVLVTIDDLEALFKLLSNHGTTEVRARFNGGHFTNPHDLRSLSDGELSYLSVETPAAQVQLRSNRASVVSPYDEIRGMVQHWASTRQTKDSPRKGDGKVSRRQRKETITACTFFLSSMALTSVSLIRQTIGNLLFISDATLMAVGNTTFVISGIWLLIDTFRQPEELTCAVIEPLTAAEYRARKQAVKLPRRANLIAAAGAVAAVVAIGVSIFLAYFAPK
ncbi:hypothetical protein ND486_11570 [Pseudonocardia sp. DR1-2]|uniref:hypothetical protein n=1 Tax=Pseudonocardia sp. DR1-2 TaxID=2951168 RepID=UPI002043A2D4|nr:hypothetical protein [Pseudonocardia sp. DR1-2]MCM3846828.1 hypothetical protein [Pseudonocardia sp. DR1-2]